MRNLWNLIWDRYFWFNRFKTCNFREITDKNYLKIFLEISSLRGPFFWKNNLFKNCSIEEWLKTPFRKENSFLCILAIMNARIALKNFIRWGDDLAREKGFLLKNLLEESDKKGKDLALGTNWTFFPIGFFGQIALKHVNFEK